VKLTAAQAAANAKLLSAKWRTVHRRLRGGTVMPLVQPSFSLRSGDLVFTMGSRFARNIEKHLAHWGCRVPMLVRGAGPRKRNPSNTVSANGSPKPSVSGPEIQFPFRPGRPHPGVPRDASMV